MSSGDGSSAWPWWSRTDYYRFVSSVSDSYLHLWNDGTMRKLVHGSHLSRDLIDPFGPGWTRRSCMSIVLRYGIQVIGLLFLGSFVRAESNHFNRLKVAISALRYVPALSCSQLAERFTRTTSGLRKLHESVM